jgi:hypothetical protein
MAFKGHQMHNSVAWGWTKIPVSPSLLIVDRRSPSKVKPFLGDHPKAAIDDRVKSGHREKA